MDGLLTLSPYANRVSDGAPSDVSSAPDNAIDSRISARARRRGKHLAQRSLVLLPGFVRERITRERHLQHVSINMQQLTDPALLGNPPVDDVRWISADKPRPPIPPGLSTDPLSGEAVDQVREWIAAYPWDHDEQLDARMDNNGDEVGRARAALRTRLRLADAPSEPHGARGDRLAFDARSLQSAAFGARGIGRFARAALLSAREAVGDGRITLIIDRGLRDLPAELAGECTQVTRIRAEEVPAFGAVISPSPMTHSPDPLVPLLHSTACSIAIVFDFIPLHYPTVYTPHVASRVEYAAALDALRLYDEFICISHLVEDELRRVLDRVPARSCVAWPRDVLPPGGGGITRAGESVRRGPIVLMTGDDPRKNTFGGLAGIAAATSNEAQRDVVVIGMAGQDTRVHHWSIAAAMRPGEARTLGRVSDAELSDMLAGASCMVVPSFDEGLSLPVIEALQAGTPVVASDIPSHRELIGAGAFLCSPGSPRSIAETVMRVRGKSAIARQQGTSLDGHQHEILEDVIRERLVPLRDRGTVSAVIDLRPRGQRLSIGIATPWSPQRTGVADYSAAVFTALARYADVTVYVTADADVSVAGIDVRSVEEVLADPDTVSDRHDAFICVLGNSHFHLVFEQLLSRIDAYVLHHDARMIEYYMALRGAGGVEQLMLMTADESAPRSIAPSLDDQVDDMRLLQNAGFWEVANRAQGLFVHTPGSAPRIEAETGREVQVLPFANYRAPAQDVITDSDRAAARAALGLDAYPPGTIHLGSFGYVDIRTKMNDIVVEAAAWLTQWGYSVALHFVGSASTAQGAQIQARAKAAGLAGFQITGFTSEEDFRNWLLAVDLGVQLRISPLLGVSGPLSDLAAYGTPAVASRGLCVDVDPPDFVQPLPDAVSSAMVAEAIEAATKAPMAPQERERLRIAYLDEKSPDRYAQALLGLLEARS